MESIKLFQYWRSSCSWRVRWALKHKGIQFESQSINLLTGQQNSAEFLGVNPSGYLPAIQVDQGVFGESLAILEWIEESNPQNPLLPINAIERLQVRQICQLICSGIQPIQNLSVNRKHSTDPAEQSAWAQDWIRTGLVKLETLVKKSAGTYCFGGELTMADICLVPQIYNAYRYNVEMGEFPTLERIYKQCMTLDHCVASSPEKQPDAVSPKN